MFNGAKCTNYYLKTLVCQVTAIQLDLVLHVDFVSVYRIVFTTECSVFDTMCSAGVHLASAIK